MQPGFQNEFLDVRTRDGLNDILLCPLIFQSANGKLYRAPRGGSTDGLSIPKIVQNIPGFSAVGGGDWWSGVLHDSPYRGQLEVWDDTAQDWVPANLTRAEADALIKEALETQLLVPLKPITPEMSAWEKAKTMTANTGIGIANAKTRSQIWLIYTALRAAGGSAWNNNRTPEGIQRNQLVTNLPKLI